MVQQNMRDVRRSIFLITVMLVCVGIMMIYSASSIYAYSSMGDSLYFLKRHASYLVVGFILMFAAMVYDLKKLQKLSKPIMLVTILLLLLVLIPHIGRETAGARRWFKLGPINFQPSEFAKIAIIIYMADLVSRKGILMKSFIKGYMPSVIILGGVVGLVLLEPDLGTAITVSLIAFIILYASGVRPSYIWGSFLASLPVLYILLFRVAYRRKRLMVFMNPWADKRGAGFQIIQSFVALGSGGPFGIGLGQSRQKLFYLPASHTDFIFSIIGEELGFAGVAAIITLFGLLIWQGMKVVFKAVDTFERSLALGIVSLIAIETIINIGVTAGALPTKGLPLPFISYGGSGLIFHLMAIGLLLNIAKSSENVR
ncbi:MAG: putative lipid II flippase FtsW [Candidatus Omnitrophica bacterium]|nr:putative lipid II flippase FtsW [Candidatus Omnitrophota bacterium]